MPSDSRDERQNSGVVGWLLAEHRGQIMKRLTGAQLFDAPKSVRKTKARLARAKLQIVAVRQRAAVTAHRYVVRALARPMRVPTVLQRRRLAERLNAKS
jgi:hypothetical protein